MAEIITLLQSLSQTVTVTEQRQLSVIVPAVLAMTGQITMLNLVRWTGKGGLQWFSHEAQQGGYSGFILALGASWAAMQPQRYQLAIYHTCVHR